VGVAIVQRGSDYVLVSGEVVEGQLVVVQGVHNVREGAKVEIKQMPDETKSAPETEPETVSSITEP